MKCFSVSNSKVQKNLSAQLGCSGIDSDVIGDCSIAKSYWYEINSEMDVKLDFYEIDNK